MATMTIGVESTAPTGPHSQSQKMKAMKTRKGEIVSRLPTKTGVTALAGLADDAPYMAQMREYRAAAEQLWPGHVVRTALIDLEGRLHEIGPGATA